jgi:hypothetical protein
LHATTLRLRATGGRSCATRLEKRDSGCENAAPGAAAAPPGAKYAIFPQQNRLSAHGIGRRIA